MNYGMLVLGASITISMFLRICGSTDISKNENKCPETRDPQLNVYDSYRDDPTLYSWITGDSFYPMEKLIKDNWYDGQMEFTNQMTEEMEIFLNGMRRWYHSNQNTPPKNPLPQEYAISYDHCDMYFDICNSGRFDESQETSTTEESHKPGDSEVPYGCRYVGISNTSLKCDDNSLTRMPALPPELVNLELSSTQIELIDINDFHDVAIQNIIMSQNKLKCIGPRAFKNVRDLKVLMLTNNEIVNISRQIYVGLPETYALHLQHNKISFKQFEMCPLWDDKIIVPVLPKLLLFYLDGNPLEVIPHQMFAGLRESPLNLLSMRSCSLTSIHPEAFKYLKNLKNLDLSENPHLMSKLYEAFQGLREASLTTLTLSNNILVDFPMDALSIVAHSLKTLDLSNNFVQFISINSFPTSMPVLENLNLENCKTSTIEEGAFEKFPNLKELFLNGNRLKEVPPSIPHLKNLRSLYLQDNTHTMATGTFQIQRRMFSNLKMLRHLGFSNVPVRHIFNDTFAGLTALNYLLLDNASITEIDDFAFSDLSVLKILMLRNNMSPKLNSLTFYGLGSLESLFLENSNLVIPVPTVRFDTKPPVIAPTVDFITVTQMINNMVEPDLEELISFPFKYLPRLQYLYLQDNRIQNLSPGLFEGSPYLTVVDLNRNLIQSWQQQIFPNGTTIQTLLLTKNSIGPITDAMLKDFVEASCVDLSSNSFLCERGACELRTMVEDANFTVQNWGIPSNYKCVDGDTYHDIVEVPEHFCRPEIVTEAPERNPSSDSNSNTFVVLSLVFSGLLLTCCLIVGYKNRLHLKYFWFVFEFNVMKMPGKEKMSVSEFAVYDYDVFISYHHEDTRFVQDYLIPEIEGVEKPIKDIEKHQHFRVCLHIRDFEAGVPIADNIVESVDRSKKVIVAVSKKYLESQWCIYEMNLAYHRLIDSRRKSFLVVLLEDIPLELRTKNLNFLMRSRTYLEWPGYEASAQKYQQFWARLRNSLNSSG